MWILRWPCLPFLPYLPWGTIILCVRGQQNITLWQKVRHHAMPHYLNKYLWKWDKKWYIWCLSKSLILFCLQDSQNICIILWESSSEETKIDQNCNVKNVIHIYHASSGDIFSGRGTVEQYEWENYWKWFLSLRGIIWIILLKIT